MAATASAMAATAIRWAPRRRRSIHGLALWLITADRHKLTHCFQPVWHSTLVITVLLMRLIVVIQTFHKYLQTNAVSIGSSMGLTRTRYRQLISARMKRKWR